VKNKDGMESTLTLLVGVDAQPFEDKVDAEKQATCSPSTCQPGEA
jgi:hypothetical protein